MVNNSIKINKTNSDLSLNTKKDHDIWRWKSMSGLEQAQTCGGIKSAMILQTLPWSPMAIHMKVFGFLSIFP